MPVFATARRLTNNVATTALAVTERLIVVDKQLIHMQQTFRHERRN
jgi:hypothetical protein